MKWQVEYSPNGFVYIVDETGKKLATVYGANEQIAVNAAVMAAAPEMQALLAGVADVLREIAETCEDAEAIGNPDVRIRIHMAAFVFGEDCKRVLAKIDGTES